MKTRFLFTGLLIFSTVFQVLALRIETGADVRITQAVHEDVYVFGSTVYIDAPVHGDIWCAGGTVTVNDTVHGDLVVAGGNIYLRGAVLDDVRAAGGTLIVSGPIAGDLLIAGGTVNVEPGGSIGGDLAMSGGTLAMGATVQGKLKAAGGNVVLNGDVEKDFEFNGGELTLNGVIGGSSKIAATRLKVGERAVLRGNVRYWTDAGEVDFGNVLQNGAVANFDPSLQMHYERPHYKFLGFASFMAVMWYLTASFILLGLAQWLFARTFNRAAGTAAAEPMRSLGYGFLYFAAVPVGAILLFATVIGIPVGLIVLLFYGLFFALSNIITASVGAHWINRRKNYNWRPINLIVVALGLLILLKLLGFMPFVGWAVKAAVVMIAFGAILDNSGVLRRRQAQVQVTP
jgi:cytoskeletal protein CcmA (bactofilin family)